MTDTYVRLVHCVGNSLTIVVHHCTVRCMVQLVHCTVVHVRTTQKPLLTLSSVGGWVIVYGDPVTPSPTKLWISWRRSCWSSSHTGWETTLATAKCSPVGPLHSATGARRQLATQRVSVCAMTKTTPAAKPAKKKGDTTVIDRVRARATDNAAKKRSKSEQKQNAGDASASPDPSPKPKRLKANKKKDVANPNKDGTSPKEAAPSKDAAQTTKAAPTKDAAASVESASVKEPTTPPKTVPEKATAAPATINLSDEVDYGSDSSSVEIERQKNLGNASEEKEIISFAEYHKKKVEETNKKLLEEHATPEASPTRPGADDNAVTAEDEDLAKEHERLESPLPSECEATPSQLHPDLQDSDPAEESDPPAPMHPAAKERLALIHNGEPDSDEEEPVAASNQQNVRAAFARAPHQTTFRDAVAHT